MRHNYGSSSTVPVENLRNKKWLEEHGHTPSIMDYARFNYVAQPGDSVGDAGMFPHIGEYDKWAIEWGYKWLPQFTSAKKEESFLNKLVSENLAKNPRLFFGTESDPNDPRNQNEDLGNNAMKASAYGIMNLKRIVPNILEWTKEPNEGYDNAKEIYDQLVIQFSRYMGHVTKNIGGITTTPSNVEQSKIVYEYTPKNVQKEAVKFLQDQLFTTPKWLLEKDLISFAGAGNMSTIANIQNSVLGRIISENTIGKLLEFEALDPSSAYKVSELFSDLKKGIWSELKTHQPIDIYRRNLQKIYVEKLIDFIRPDDKKGVVTTSAMPRPTSTIIMDNRLNDGISIVKGQARKLVAEIGKEFPLIDDTNSKLHLQDVMERLKVALDPKS